MKTVGPLARYGDVVWTSGNTPHEGGSDAALFLADTKSNAIEVYLLSRRTLSHRAEKGAAIPLEGDAKTFLANLAKGKESGRKFGANAMRTKCVLLFTGLVLVAGVLGTGAPCRAQETASAKDGVLGAIAKSLTGDVYAEPSRWRELSLGSFFTEGERGARRRAVGLGRLSDAAHSRDAVGHPADGTGTGPMARASWRMLQ